MLWCVVLKKNGVRAHFREGIVDGRKKGRKEGVSRNYGFSGRNALREEGF